MHAIYSINQQATEWRVAWAWPRIIPSTMSSNKYIYKAILLFPICKEQAK